MKTKYSTLSILVILWSFGLSAQDFASSHITLLDFGILPSYEVMNQLDPYEPYTTREKQNFHESKMLFDELVMNNLLTYVYGQLSEERNIKLENKDALRDYISYSSSGLPLFIIPKSAIKNVLKKGYETDYFFHFSLNTNARPGLVPLPGQTRTEVVCTLKIFDTNRTVVKKIQKKIAGEDLIRAREFPRSRFDKLDQRHVEILFERLRPQIEDAIDAVIVSL